LKEENDPIFWKIKDDLKKNNATKKNKKQAGAELCQAQFQLRLAIPAFLQVC
jgi:hypothetical protein